MITLGQMDGEVGIRTWVVVQVGEVGGTDWEFGPFGEIGFLEHVGCCAYL